jgi:hypothetical protein
MNENKTWRMKTKLGAILSVVMCLSLLSMVFLFKDEEKILNATSTGSNKVSPTNYPKILQEDIGILQYTNLTYKLFERASKAKKLNTSEEKEWDECLADPDFFRMVELFTYHQNTSTRIVLMLLQYIDGRCLYLWMSKLYLPVPKVDRVLGVTAPGEVQNETISEKPMSNGGFRVTLSDFRTKVCC